MKSTEMILKETNIINLQLIMKFVMNASAQKIDNKIIQKVLSISLVIFCLINQNLKLNLCNAVGLIKVIIEY